MKASEVIKHLQWAIEQDGDMEVIVAPFEGDESIQTGSVEVEETKYLKETDCGCCNMEVSGKAIVITIKY